MRTDDRAVASRVTEEMLLETWRAWVDETLPKQRSSGPDAGGFDLGEAWCDGREAAFIAAHLIAVRCWPGGLHDDPDSLDEAIRRVLRFLLRRQDERGRIDLNGAFGANEVGFTLPALVEGHRAIATYARPELGDVLDDLETYLRRGAEAVLDGDAYTANHRWAAACAPLAAMQALWPDERYLVKIESYLADGIDCAADGAWYEERSPNYNMVANHGLMVMADELDRPELMAPVLRSLDFALHCIQPNGEADSTFSHRQDRAQPHRRSATYVVARRAAQLTGDGRLTALGDHAWRNGGAGVDLMPPLFALLRHPEPVPEPVAPPTRYERVFPSCSAARVRDGDTALTLAADPGGHFFDTVRDQWGGPRRSDSWFHLHHGDVVIETVHMAVAGMANLQPRELTALDPGRYRLAGSVDGWTHTLHFRPGRPEVAMEWDWEHEIDVAWHDDHIGLHLASATPHSLHATLHLWLRPDVLVEEAGRAPVELRAGRSHGLSGGGPVRLRSGTSCVELVGLPQSAHRVVTRYPPSIPTHVEETCADITLGLTVPVALDLQIRW